MADFHHKFINEYATMAVPMMDQIKAHCQDFQWGKEQHCSFDKLKVTLATDPILAIVDSSKPFVLEIDASN